MATSAKAWREAREEGVELTFPSKLVARIRPLNVDFFVMNNEVPDFLTPTVLKMINNESYSIELPAHEQLEKSKTFLSFLNTLVRAAFVSPSVAAEEGQGTPPEDQITVGDISYADKVFVYQFFGRPAQVLRGFRESQINPVASVDAAKNNGAGAKQGARDKALVKPVAGNA